PSLWEQRPEGLLQLLAESRCRPVHEFAAKALRACVEFCDRLDVDAIRMLLERPYEATAEVGYEIAARRYRRGAPDLELVLAVATCVSPRARAAAHAWIEADRAIFLRDTSFVAAIVTSAHADTRQVAR